MAELADSYRWCRELCRQSGSNFYVSFGLLDKAQRDAMYALYAFARISDDLSDGLSQPPNSKTTTAETTESAASRLSEWSSLVDQNLPPAKDSQSSSQLPRQNDSLANYKEIWPALGDACQRYSIEKNLLQDIVRGVQMDTNHQQPRDWQELESYCYHVASTVGLACSRIWRKPNAEVPREAAIRCGYAFQYTNILRDLAEDARLQRIYLPRTLFQENETDPQAWLAGEPNPGWERLVDQVARIAISHYEYSWPLIDYFTNSGGKMFSLIWRTYRSLLDRVVDNKSKLWTPNYRVRLSGVEKAKLFAQHYVSPLYHRLPPPCPCR